MLEGDGKTHGDAENGILRTLKRWPRKTMNKKEDYARQPDAEAACGPLTRYPDHG